MFRQGARVVVVDEVEARSHCAMVHNGQEGTIEGSAHCPGSVSVRIDGDPAPRPWLMPAFCVKRIRKPKVKG